MARPGIYRTDVERARRALLAAGRNPSIDNLRSALGNTGSRTTILRHLREIEADEGDGEPAKAGLSDALTDLVARLAAQLQGNADEVVAAARHEFNVTVGEQTRALNAAHEEARALRERLTRAEAERNDARAAHRATQAALAEATTATVQLAERIDGLQALLAERDVHLAAIERKHDQALEHERTASQQRQDDERRRHALEVQTLRVELGQRSDALEASQQEVRELAAERTRLTEQVEAHIREQEHERAATAALVARLDALTPLVDEHPRLQARYDDALVRLARLTNELAVAQGALAEATVTRQAFDVERAQWQARLSTVDELVARLRAAPAAKRLKRGRDTRRSAAEPRS